MYNGSMVLSRNAIEEAISRGIIGIKPFRGEQLEAAHINLHLARASSMDDRGQLTIEAGGFLTAHTLEKITLPGTLCGFIEGRSKLAQQGISVEQSSTFVEPGSDNTLVLEIYNASNREVQLQYGQKIAKLIVMKIVDKL